MKIQSIKKWAIVSCLAALGMSVSAGENTPKGWLHAGSRPADYEMGTDQSNPYQGAACATVKCTATNPEGFGTLMQTFPADSYRGQRVKLSAYVKSADVTPWSGLWMRVDGALIKGSDMPAPLAFDNMQKRPIQGTTGWTKYEIVLDVPEQAQKIAFGILLTGKGQVWLDAVQFETVGKDTPTTGDPIKPAETANANPVNLDFEDSQ